MLERTIELLSGLFSIALILLILFCILGSVVAALRAIGRGEVTSADSREVQRLVSSIIKKMQLRSGRAA